MDAWDGWELGRVIVALTAVMYMGVWAQVSLFHWAGAFKRLSMWGPVLATPLIIAGIVIAVVARDGLWGWIGLAALAVGAIEGLVGLALHLQGMRYQIGGLASKRNLLSGPPPMLPVAYSLVGVFGLLGLLWGA